VVFKEACADNSGVLDLIKKRFVGKEADVDVSIS